VTRVEDGGLGLSFVHLPEDDARRLSELVARVQLR
jgi:hypothetical protein